MTDNTTVYTLHRV